MAKVRSKFTCQQCGYVSLQFYGRCPECNEWNSLVESVNITKESKHRRIQDSNSTVKPVALSDIKLQTKKRIKTNIEELDHVLGGGLIPGQVVLLAGEPGVGKSTLLLQVVKELRENQILYASGEESPEQILLRAKRLGFSKKQSKALTLFPETNVESVISELSSKKFNIGAVDSIQTMWSESLTGAPGSVGQVRACAYSLIQSAKHTHIPTIIVGQVTKEGSIAGPKVLEHLVDTVLYMEGSRFEDTRIVRVTKNRFGPTDEIGVFEMKENGLREIANPSRSFISRKKAPMPGQSTVVVMEGTRPILVEIQALVSHSDLKSPRRVGNGISFNRLTMLCAIVSKHLRVPLERFDVYVNVSGGLTISEPAADLGIVLSIYSSFKNVSLVKTSVSIGEVSLLGEIQDVSRMDKRIREAERLGYTTIISSKTYSYLQQAVNKTISK